MKTFGRKSTKAYNTNARRRVFSVVMIMMIFVMLVTGLADPAAVNAETETDYYITKYDMDLKVNKDHSYDVFKAYTVTIPQDLTSLDIKIPAGNYSLADISINCGSRKFSSSGNYRVITVTSPEDLTAGEHTFNISYKIEEYADHNDSMDTLYVNLLPPDWERAIVSFKATVIVPDDFNVRSISVYSGQYGSKDDGVLKRTDSGKKMILTGEDIPSDYGITLKAELPNGYWQDVLDNAWTASFSAIIMGLGLILIMLLWVIGGKDPKTVPTREVVPIDGVMPSDIGYIFTGETRIKDIITLIIYLGIKGALRICEYEPKKYKLIKLAEPKDEARFVRGVYHTLFDDVYEGRALEMQDIGPRLRTALNNTALDIESGYSSKDMQACTDLSRVLRYVSLAVMAVCVGLIPILADMYQYKSISYVRPFVVTVLAFITSGLVAHMFDNQYETENRTYIMRIAATTVLYLIVLGYAANTVAKASGSYLWPVVIMVFGAIALFFICIMKARASGNAVMVARLLSLRRYIDKADPEDHAELMAENGDYYYDMLPYAFQFSLLDKWAKKYRWMGVRPAELYVDEISGHAVTNVMRSSTTIETARELNTFARTIESEYLAMEHKYRLFS